MSIAKMTISGYRGFKYPGEIKFAVPNGSLGSGLTVITGSNNSGKSSILECLRARNGENISFSSGSRNISSDFVEISYLINDRMEVLSSVRRGSSETQRHNKLGDFEIFVLQSRRSFNTYFNKHVYNRDDFLRSAGLPSQRTPLLQGFEYRLFNVMNNQEPFNKILKEIFGADYDWSIDMSEQGGYFLKFVKGENSHSSDGMGEGIISIFAIADALYDSRPGNAVVIDEPELSLHPSLQKRLMKVLCNYAKDRQIIIATHSPYFLNLDYLAAGMRVVKVGTGDEGTTINMLSQEAADSLGRLIINKRNPHIFGLDARELFFQEDGIILTEGQDDVIYFPIAFAELGINLPGSFFGWGAGGAENVDKICQVFMDLGFRRIAAILDNDKADKIPNLRTKYPKYFFDILPAKDIRTKDAVKERSKVEGLLDEDYKVRGELIADARSLFQRIIGYMVERSAAINAPPPNSPPPVPQPPAAR